MKRKAVQIYLISYIYYYIFSSETYKTTAQDSNFVRVIE